MAEPRNPIQRLLRIEPGIALTQWVYDRVINNWVLITSGLGSGVMGAFAWATEFLKPYGAFGIASVVLITALNIWWVAALVRLLAAKRGTYRADESLKRAQENAVEKWKHDVDGINPLDTDFQRKRIRLVDLKHPILPRVINKRFVDCELLGPANVGFYSINPSSSFGFQDCDLVVMNPVHAVPLNNVIFLENTHLVNCTIFNCTVFISPNNIQLFKQMGAKFVSFTGDPQIDNQQQQGTEQKTQP